jgi:hypothetical protein
MPGTPRIPAHLALLAGLGLALLSASCFVASDDSIAKGGTNGTTEESGSGAPQDLPSNPTTGDGDPTTEGDGDPTTEGDGDPTTEGDGDPTTEGDGDPTPTCGNGIVDPGEQCDGANLNGFSCVDLGYSGGMLACDPLTCTFDASGCTTNTDGGGTGG